MHKGFLREATILGLVTESLVYSDPTNADETKNVIAWLKRLQFRHVLVLCYEETLDPILTTAAAQEAIGPGYLYVFPCFDVFVLQDNLRVQSGGYRIVSGPSQFIRRSVLNVPLFVPWQDLLLHNLSMGPP
jgi:hypothetical protein